LKKSYLKISYILFDVVGSAAAWILFCLYRLRKFDPEVLGSGSSLVFNGKFYASLVSYVLFWLALFIVAGFYSNVFRKSRLKEFTTSLGYTLVGTVAIYFILLIDNSWASYSDYYSTIGYMFILEFSLTYFPRLTLTTSTIRRIHRRIIGFPTIIVGNGGKGLQVFRELEAEKKSQGFRFVGYIAQANAHEDMLQNQLDKLGEMNSIAEVVNRHGVEEVILAVEGEDVSTLTRCINELLPLNVSLKAIPSMYDFLLGRVKMTGILNAPLISISFDLMPMWQANVKRLADYTVSVLAMVMLFAVALILRSRNKDVHPKRTYNFQAGENWTVTAGLSGYTSSGVCMPMLKIMGQPFQARMIQGLHLLRRLCEKQNLTKSQTSSMWLKGEMSLVGPRPERQCYIEQIVRVAPHYVHLQKVKPGITSWGQVNFCYAKNV
jgi:hypothetical protein